MFKLILLPAIGLLVLLLIACKTDAAEPLPGFTFVAPQATSTPFVTTISMEINSWRCFEDALGFAYVEGEVTNVANQRLENVLAIVTWRTSDGRFITSDEALLKFNPIMPGQTSPFKTISTSNPLMKKCSLEFKHLFGGKITTIDKSDR